MRVSRLVAGTVSAIAAGAGLLAVALTTPAQAGSTPMITPGGGCSATARIDSQWGSGTSGGQIVKVTVTNTSAAVTAQWSVAWTLGSGQTVRSSWNAQVSTSGSALTATNTGYNGKLAPGATTTFGVQLAGVAAPPTLTCDNGAGTPDTDVTVTEADTGGSVTLRVGQTLGVKLPSGYATPVASGAALTQLSSSAGTTVFRGAAIGIVDVTSGAFTVHVTVLGPSSTGAGSSYTVTLADNLKTLAIISGDILQVNLPSDYVPPTTTPDGILLLTSVTGGYPTNQPLVATYVTRSPGSTDVKSRQDTACNHDVPPCPTPLVSWTLHVIVS
jgi:cellulose binding protein with CBM2 domain